MTKQLVIKFKEKNINLIIGVDWDRWLVGEEGIRLGKFLRRRSDLSGNKCCGGRIKTSK